MQFIYPLNRLPDEKEHLAGGKAKSLAHMMKNLKLRIPDGFVILSGAVKNNELLNQAGEELDELIRLLDANHTYAVRSSALNEDGEAASFAGQYETVTDVKKEEIKEAVLKVAKSVENDTVAAYTNKQNRDAADSSVTHSKEEPKSGIGIVIQRFVKAKLVSPSEQSGIPMKDPKNFENMRKSWEIMAKPSGGFTACLWISNGPSQGEKYTFCRPARLPHFVA